MPVSSRSNQTFEMFGLPWYLFAALAAIVFVSAAAGALPKGMIGAFSFMIVVGTIFDEIGNRVPIVNTYLGGGPIVIIFGSAMLVYFGLLGERTTQIVDTFMKGNGFLDFYIAALITGSILGMNRRLLINAAIRYFPAILGGVALSLSLAYVVGSIIGYGGQQAMFFVAIPIMGGGMGAGAVPLSQIFSAQTGTPAETLLSMMVPAVALGNAMSIVMGGLLDVLGKKVRWMSGDGQLVRNFVNDSSIEEQEKAKDSTQITLQNLGVGLLMATTFFSVGTIIAKFVPAIHSYAWMIVSVAVVKATGLLPDRFEISCHQWFQFIMKNLTTTLLVGIGISYTSMAEVIAAFSGSYLILVFVTVIGAVIGAGAIGWLVGFFPIESAITAGLCMSNMGGTGDVAVLSAAKRMELMPFGQISSRIGGAFMLLLSSFLLRVLGFVL